MPDCLHSHVWLPANSMAFLASRQDTTDPSRVSCVLDRLPKSLGCRDWENLCRLPRVPTSSLDNFTDAPAALGLHHRQVLHHLIGVLLPLFYVCIEWSPLFFLALFAYPMVTILTYHVLRNTCVKETFCFLRPIQGSKIALFVRLWLMTHLRINKIYALMLYWLEDHK
jgi:hypothetical protein